MKSKVYGRYTNTDFFFEAKHRKRNKERFKSAAFSSNSYIYLRDQDEGGKAHEGG